jgi:hypothetical protein
MSNRVIEVPTEVRQKAAAQGAEGRRWLRRLGEVVGELERDWDLEVGATFREARIPTSPKPRPAMASGPSSSSRC